MSLQSKLFISNFKITYEMKWAWENCKIAVFMFISLFNLHFHVTSNIYEEPVSNKK